MSCSSFFNKLEKNYPGQLGSSDGFRVQDPFCKASSSGATASYNNQVRGSSKRHGQCHSATSKKGSNQGCTACRRPVHFFLVFRGEGHTGEAVSTYYQTLKQICRSWPFKMEGLPVVCSLIQPKDYMMKLDLQDAYYSMSVHKEYSKFLRLVFNAKTFEFQCLPFGQKSAPRAFTRRMIPIIAHIRNLDIPVWTYHVSR